MRLTTEQTAIIKQTTAQVFGENVQVFLFGSRVDDNQKGGDIDLLIELSQDMDDAVARSIRLNGRLQQKLGQQKIDIIIYMPNQSILPIHQSAKATGILL